MKVNKVTIKKGYSIKELGGEFCIVYDNDSNNGAVNGLPSINETGIFLWERVSKGESVLELIQSLMKKNNLEYDDAQADVGEFLAKLINGKIVDVT